MAERASSGQASDQAAQASSKAAQDEADVNGKYCVAALQVLAWRNCMCTA